MKKEKTTHMYHFKMLFILIATSFLGSCQGTHEPNFDVESTEVEQAPEEEKIQEVTPEKQNPSDVYIDYIVQIQTMITSTASYAKLSANFETGFSLLSSPHSKFDGASEQSNVYVYTLHEYMDSEETPLVWYIFDPIKGQLFERINKDDKQLMLEVDQSLLDEFMKIYEKSVKN